MGTVVIENFAGGVDRSRPIYAMANGTLWEGINGHLTRGGDFEKRKAFVSALTLPANTFGLFTLGKNLYVFGSIATPVGFPFSVSMPSGVPFPNGMTIQYRRLQHTTPSIAMTALLFADVFEGNIYAIAKFADGAIFHYHGTTMLTHWNGLGAGYPTTKGVIAKTYKRKIYSAAGSLLYFSGLDHPEYWYWGTSPAPTYPGAGFLNMSNHQTGSETVTAIGVYKSQLAVFARRIIQLWSMQNDPTLNVPAQIISETGTRSPKSVRGFGDFDTFYLSDSGIRSLRAADYASTAGVVDVGTPIDTLVRAQLESVTDADVERAVACVEPIDGRFWLVLGDKIFVFSYFPTKKITGWSWYEPGVSISELAAIEDRIWCRAGDTVLLYGGTDNATYDDAVATMQLPFISMREQSSYKQCIGFDAAVSGTWNVDLMLDPNDLGQIVQVGLVDNMTYNDPNIGAVGYGTHIAPRLVSQGTGAAAVSSVALHFFPGAKDAGSK
jgi:hypothetical protein